MNLYWLGRGQRDRADADEQDRRFGSQVGIDIEFDDSVQAGLDCNDLGGSCECGSGMEHEHIVDVAAGAFGIDRSQVDPVISMCEVRYAVPRRIRDAALGQRIEFKPVVSSIAGEDVTTGAADHDILSRATRETVEPVSASETVGTSKP